MATSRSFDSPSSPTWTQRPSRDSNGEPFIRRGSRDKSPRESFGAASGTSLRTVGHETLDSNSAAFYSECARPVSSKPESLRGEREERSFGQTWGQRNSSIIQVSGGTGSVPILSTLAAPIRPGGEPELRLLDREAAFGQSTGRFHVKRMLRNQMISILRYGDLFHTVVHHSTPKILCGFCFSYAATHTFFSLIYWLISDPCHFEIQSWLDAFFLSVQLGMTIGWGLPGHPYLKKDIREKQGCWSGAVCILVHTLVMQVQNALLIGILYARISRGTKRSSSIAFSDRAVIREIKGKLYFMFQVCELRKHQLTEAHVRCYALCSPVEPTDERGGENHSDENDIGNAVNVRQYPMRLVHPDDELGGTLLLALPSVVVHEIDAWSPFAQKDHLVDDFRGVVRRSADIGPHGSPDGEQRKPPNREAVEEFLHNNWVEVICLIEGMEPTTSATIQARHSYGNEDLVFDHAFAPSVSRHRAGGGSWVVDFDRFHTLVSMPPTGAYGAPAQESSLSQSTSAELLCSESLN